MSFFLDNWILFSVALTSGALLLWPALTSGGGASGLNPTQVVQLMNREKATVIDVCEPSEFAAGHILGAKNLPLAQLEAQLARAQRLETVGQLTGGIAHDFNNLLAIVMGSADLLLDRVPPEGESTEMVQMILAAAERGAALTDRLLTASHAAANANH